MKAETLNLGNAPTGAILKALSDKQKDDIYRALWAEHVREDVLGWISDNKQQLLLKPAMLECVINSVTERYVYECDYDCNQSYWDNIENLVEEEYTVYEQEEYNR